MLKRIKNVWKMLVEKVLFQLAPPLVVWRTNRRIQKPSQERTQLWIELPRETLLRVISEEWERAKSLEDKLTKTTAALSIAGAVSGAASKPLLDGLVASPMKIAVLVFLLISVISLFSGIMMGFSGLRPRPRGGIGPDFAVMTQSNGQVSKAACVDALIDFEVSNIRRANEAAGANVAIRNGILSFVLATLVAMFAPRAPQPTPTHYSSAEISVSVIAAPATSTAVPPKATRIQLQKH